MTLAVARRPKPLSEDELAWLVQGAEVRHRTGDGGLQARAILELRNLRAYVGQLESALAAERSARDDAELDRGATIAMQALTALVLGLIGLWAMWP